MNTTINEAISRKRKTDINKPISLNTHLISKRTKPYITTIPSNDQAAALTFVSNHTHTTTHTNLSTIFMLIPEVRLFFCFVLSFLFSMTFFFCGIRQIGWFLFRIGSKRSEMWYRQIFCIKYARNAVQRKILDKTRSAPNFSYHISGIPLPIEQKLVEQDASDNEEWERGTILENKELQRKWS